jgi:CheY-like chemotaxis protein
MAYPFNFLRMTRVRGKIILIDDNSLEEELLRECITKGKWNAQVEYFADAEEALKYLEQTNETIFLIICDMNMPKMSGLDLKKIIDRDRKLRAKLIPFIFATTTATKPEIVEAYEYGVQGYFEKPIEVDKVCQMIDAIFNYWMLSLNPNKMR